jgi:hypothetical protein
MCDDTSAFKKGFDENVVWINSDVPERTSWVITPEDRRTFGRTNKDSLLQIPHVQETRES